MRISDWSSDVCSSDLLRRVFGIEMQRVRVHRQQREPDVVRFGDGAAGPVLVDVADLEVLEIATDLLAITIGADLSDPVNHAFLSPRRPSRRRPAPARPRSAEHTSELKSLMRTSYAVF